MIISDPRRCSPYAPWRKFLVPILLFAVVLFVLLLWPLGTSREASAVRVSQGEKDGRGLDGADLAVALGGGAVGLSTRAATTFDEEAVRRRGTAAVLGAIVADAATMGLHWIYDLDKIRALVSEHGRKDDPAFFQPPSCPYYDYESGALSPYGDELMPVLQYLTIGPGGQREGTMDGPSFAQFLAEYYANYTGRLNKSSRSMMEALLQGGHGWPECGDPRDTQANNYVKVVPIVARYAGQPGLIQAVDAAVRAQQNNDDAVMYGLLAALVLERVILGASIAEAVQWVSDGGPGSGVSLSRTALEALQAVVRNRNSGTPLRDLLYSPGTSNKPGSWGPSCANPGALQGALLGALRASEAAHGDSDNGADDTVYTRGVRANMLLGGDNCSRGLLLGALLAAEAGSAAIPFAWRTKTRMYHSSEVLVEQLLEYRSASA